MAANGPIYLQYLHDCLQALQLTKLNRATYAILLDVSPIVDPENNVLQHYMESDIVQVILASHWSTQTQY